MTLSSTEVIVRTTADGVQVLYPYDFRIDLDSHVEIFFDEHLQEENLYTVDRNVDNIGGSVTFLTAPTNGVVVGVARVLPLTQETNYNPYDPFPAESHEKALDWLTMMLQQHQEDIDILFARGDPNTEGDLIINGNIWAQAIDDIVTDYGFGIRDSDGSWRGTWVYDEATASIHLVEHLGEGSVKTRFQIKDGIATITGAGGIGQLPVNPNDLATKQYVDSVIGGTPGAYLPLTGGELAGELVVATEVQIKSDTGFAGYTIYGLVADFKGAFDYNSADDAMQVVQAGAGGGGAVDTVFSLLGGKATVTSNNGLSTVPVAGNDLANKTYVDGFVSKTGNSDITGDVAFYGTMNVKNEFWVQEYNFPSVVGMSLRDAGGQIRGAFDWVTSSGAIDINQGPSSGTVDTQATFVDGKIKVQSYTGKDTTPTDNLHLANKQYVDTGTLALQNAVNTAEVSLLNLITALQNQVTALQAQVDALP